MPVTDISIDPQALTMTLTADVDAPVERLWAAFATPAQLERFWGPPGYPARFASFDVVPGGRAHYVMTSPEGQCHGGSWEFVAIDDPRSFAVLDRFVDEAGMPVEGMPVMRMRFVFASTDGGSRLSAVTRFDSIEGLEQAVAMGAVEGSRLAIDQLDGVLPEHTAARGATLELLDDTHVRITRVIAGPLEAVWRACTDPSLIERWMLGPEGWIITEHRQSLEPGGRHRTMWAPAGAGGGEPFGFEGVTVLVDPQRRIVTTESMVGAPDSETLNDLAFYGEADRTLLTLVITYPDVDTRDAILATGMIEGMEASYARLERLLNR